MLSSTTVKVKTLSVDQVFTFVSNMQTKFYDTLLVRLLRLSKGFLLPLLLRAK